MDNGIELPRYNCHKQVWALKIKKLYNPAISEEDDDGSIMMIPEDDRYAGFLVPKELMDKHKPEVGWYYVVYKDGYVSFSPPEAFEEGYSLA